MADFVPSLIRTYVPIWVTIGLGWFQDATNITDLDTAQISITVVGIVISLYYGIVRAVGLKFPAVEVLLGRKSTPQYEDV